MLAIFTTLYYINISPPCMVKSRAISRSKRRTSEPLRHLTSKAVGGNEVLRRAGGMPVTKRLLVVCWGHATMSIYITCVCILCIIYIHTYIYTYVHIYVYIYVCVYVYVYMYTQCITHFHICIMHSYVCVSSYHTYKTHTHCVTPHHIAVQ